jgi:hypothetical protein
MADLDQALRESVTRWGQEKVKPTRR